MNPGQVTMTEDLCIRVIDLQAAEQVDHRVLLSRRARISRFAIGIEATFVANAYRMGVVATGMSSRHLFGTTLVHLSILGNVVVIANGFETSGQVTGFER